MRPLFKVWSPGWTPRQALENREKGSNVTEKTLIVVGVDGSEHSATALRRAVEEARVWNADLQVVHVTDFTLAFHFVADTVVVDVAELARIQRDAVWAATDEILDELDYKVTKVDLEGYPADTLVDYCSEQEADLLVLGTRGRGRLASTLLGSTSMRALEQSSCDVLIAKPR